MTSNLAPLLGVAAIWLASPAAASTKESHIDTTVGLVTGDLLMARDGRVSTVSSLETAIT